MGTWPTPSASGSQPGTIFFTPIPSKDKIKTQASEREKMFANEASNRGLIKTYKQLMQVN